MNERLDLKLSALSPIVGFFIAELNGTLYGEAMMSLAAKNTLNFIENRGCKFKECIEAIAPLKVNFLVYGSRNVIYGHVDKSYHITLCYSK